MCQEAGGETAQLLGLLGLCYHRQELVGGQARLLRGLQGWV